MSETVCPHCGGRYLRVQADGSLYVHVCPPLPPPPPPKRGLVRRLLESLRRK